ncbi:ATPase SWSAP1 isoform X1 [Entelurus aequoreus]|uniref:ATPase SWSAP1 isoform X1 n=1 Tax=Entelurus aequoreus TaxID=161455 RepID=UPI002B1D9ADB|nr:ATPase SWSAP1 isoform X1 [Entelurus aequoreus]
MADVLTHMFANLSPADSKKDFVTPAPAECGVLIVGEQSLGRSLLLLTAVTAASQGGMKVVFFAPQQIQSLPASLQKCVPSLSPESLKKITFCYPRTAEELRRQIAGLHESSSTFPPSLIIVDRLEDYPCDGHSGHHPGSGRVQEEEEVVERLQSLEKRFCLKSLGKTIIKTFVNSAHLASGVCISGTASTRRLQLGSRPPAWTRTLTPLSCPRPHVCSQTSEPALPLLDFRLMLNTPGNTHQLIHTQMHTIHLFGLVHTLHF